MKDVFIEGGDKSCGKAETMEQAIDLAWKYFPDDIKEQTKKEEVGGIETKTQFIIL